MLKGELTVGYDQTLNCLGVNACPGYHASLNKILLRMNA